MGRTRKGRVSCQHHGQREQLGSRRNILWTHEPWGPLLLLQGLPLSSGTLLLPAFSTSVWNKHCVWSPVSTREDDGKWWEVLLYPLLLHCCVSGISVKQERFLLTWRPHSIQTEKPGGMAQSIVSEAGSWGTLCHGTLASKDRWGLSQGLGFMLHDPFPGTVYSFLKQCCPLRDSRAQREPEGPIHILAIVHCILFSRPN